MLTTVVGGTRAEKKLAYKVVPFISEILISPKLLFSMDCTVRIQKHLNIYGSCSWMDTNIRPKIFEILIARQLDKQDFIETLCHEIVHLKQYARNQLRETYVKSHKIWWYKEDHTDTPYDLQPWEIEAGLLERELYLNFINNE